MRIRIQCACGETLLIDPAVAGPMIRCGACGRTYSPPTVRQDEAGVISASPLHSHDRRSATWASPLVGSLLGMAAISGALIWALMAGGFGGGGGGTGEGMGPLAAGEGSGTGQTGDGGGAGTDGLGTGADQSSPDAPPAVVASPETRPAPEPITEPAPPVKKGFGDLTEIKPPPPPPPPAPRRDVLAGGGDSGREGAAGGGGAGREGKDVGARGDVSFTLTWTYNRDVQGRDRRGGPDVDIWVRDPTGQHINTSQDRGVGLGPTPEGGRADVDDRGGHGPGDGGGAERIFWPEGHAPVGTYTYGVRWYCGDGSARFTLRVYKGKGPTPVASKTGMLTERDKGKEIRLGEIVSGRE